MAEASTLKCAAALAQREPPEVLTAVWGAPDRRLRGGCAGYQGGGGGRGVAEWLRPGGSSDPAPQVGLSVLLGHPRAPVSLQKPIEMANDAEQL